MALIKLEITAGDADELKGVLRGLAELNHVTVNKPDDGSEAIDLEPGTVHNDPEGPTKRRGRPAKAAQTAEEPKTTAASVTPASTTSQAATPGPQTLFEAQKPSSVDPFKEQVKQAAAEVAADEQGDAKVSDINDVRMALKKLVMSKGASVAGELLDKHFKVDGVSKLDAKDYDSAIELMEKAAA